MVAFSLPGTADPPHSTKNTFAVTLATGFLLSGMNSSPPSSDGSDGGGVAPLPGAGVGDSGWGRVTGVTVTGKGTVTTASLAGLDDVGSSSVMVLQPANTSPARKRRDSLRPMSDSFT